MESPHSSNLNDILGKLIVGGCTAESEAEIYRSVVKYLPLLIPAERVSIALLKADQGAFEVFALEGHQGEPKLGTIFSVNKVTAIQSVVLTGQSKIFNFKPDSPYIDLRALAKDGFSETIIAPLKLGDRLLGTINIGSRVPKRYTDEDRAVLSQIATLLSVNIERLQLIHQTQATLERHRSYAGRLEILNSIGQRLATATTEEAVFHIVATAINHILDAERVSYVVPDSQKNTCQIFALTGNDILPKAHEFPLEGTGIAAVIQAGQPMSFPDLADSHYYEHTKLVEQGLKMGWSVPIYVSDTLVGILNAGTTIVWPFPDDALTLLSALGGFMEATIERINAQKDVVSTLDKLEYQVNHDRLTKLPNRHWFDRELPAEIEYHQEHQKYLCVLFIDLDGFKQINDSLSHSIGDQLLCAVAKRLRQQVAARDAVARLGGDEFVVLLKDIHSQDQSLQIAQRVLESLQQPFVIAEHHIQIGGSLGLSYYPEHGQTADELMKYADIAMYAAKAKGRNNCQIYATHMSSQLKQRLEIERDLRQAILEQDSLFLQFQPQFDLTTGQVLSIESLIRWHHPTKGIITPDVFIPIAEESGLICDILTWVIDKSLQALAVLRPKYPNLYVSINISAQDFLRPEPLKEKIETSLHQYNFTGDVLELELTEGIFLEHADIASEIIQSLKQQGIRLAIDDFGTGFSSLNYLLNLPMDTLKIDRTFVQSIHTDSRKKGIVKTILSLAENLQLTSVAEGVESEAQLVCLSQLGCQMVQGYLLAKPMSLEALEKYLEQSCSKFGVNLDEMFSPIRNIDTR